VQAGEIVGIDVLDHIIIGGKSYTSLKRMGLF
jgi:DNA repair protein RadC